MMWSFIKSLFGEEENSCVRLDESFWEEDKVTFSENETLEAPFSQEETRMAIFGSYAEGAPGPDRFPFLFYDVFWKILKVSL
jgi:hypothetical protein